MQIHSAEYYIDNLGLQPHIEGGYFREIYRSTLMMDPKNIPSNPDAGRNLSTTIYFLLKSGQCSTFHSLKSDEIWFHHAGSPLRVYCLHPDGSSSVSLIGSNILKDESPQFLFSAGVIFGAEVVDDDSFALVSCMVSPGFDYRDFTLFPTDELVSLYPEQEGIITRMNSHG